MVPDVEADLKSLLAGFRRRRSKKPILEKISTMRRGRGKEDGEFEVRFDWERSDERRLERSVFQQDIYTAFLQN